MAGEDLNLVPSCNQTLDEVIDPEVLRPKVLTDYADPQPRGRDLTSQIIGIGFDRFPERRRLAEGTAYPDIMSERGPDR